MQVPVTQTATELREQQTPGLWPHVAMTALTLAILGGLVLWHLRANSDPSAPPLVYDAVPVAAAQAAGSADGTFTVILVRSPEQAAIWEAAINDSSYTVGQPPPRNVHVLVAGTAEAAAEARQVIRWAELDSPTGNVQVLDLRARAGAP